MFGAIGALQDWDSAGPNRSQLLEGVLLYFLVGGSKHSDMKLIGQRKDTIFNMYGACMVLHDTINAFAHSSLVIALSLVGSQWFKLPLGEISEGQPWPEG